MTLPRQLGGSFAPPLDTAKLAAYRTLAEGAEPQISEVMLKLCEMVAVFQQTPASTLPGTPHPIGEMVIAGKKRPAPIVVPLEEAEVKRIWDHVPWDYEIESYKALFERLTDKPTRDAAFHLLWFAVELEKDREPLTADRVL